MIKKLIAAAAFVAVGSASAFAADMAPRPYTKAPMLEAAYNWSGFYIGAHVGGAIGTNEWSNVQDPTGTNCCGLAAGSGNTNGIFGGGQVGYNWQAGWAVFGIEGEISGSDIKGRTLLKPADYAGDDRIRTNYVATVTGRIGGVVHGDTLVYIKGGAAFLRNTYDISVNDFGTLEGTYPRMTDSRTGYVVGFGTEYAFDSHWSGKIEYNFMDFGTRTLNFAQGSSGDDNTAPFRVDVPLTMHTLKIGVNYKLGTY